jgi:hypothetical protein
MQDVQAYYSHWSTSGDKELQYDKQIPTFVIPTVNQPCKEIPTFVIPTVNQPFNNYTTDAVYNLVKSHK